MPFIAVNNACLAFGHVPLLDQVELQIDAGERVALIGRNGSGKSSLLKAIAGQTTLDDGSVWLQPGLRISYVPQEADFALDASLYDTLAGGLGIHARLLQDYHAVLQQLAHDDSAALLEKMSDLQQQIDTADAWRLEQRVNEALSQLALDGNMPVNQLSGGGIKRVALARALVSEPELLLLDEPTNHLDVDGIEALETLINGFNGAILLITHDRVFLDRTATRIVELDRGILRSYPGRFQDYLRRKEEELEAEAKADARFDKFLAQEEVWIRKGVEARRTRNEGRVRRLEALRRERAARRDRTGNARFSLHSGEESGKMVAELTDVSKSYDGRTVVRDFSTRIMRGDRIGLVGPNGAGKTTLLKLILGQIAPDSGSVRRGTRQTVAYFDQMRAQLDPELPLTEVISPGSEYIEINGERKHVIGYLGDFLFAPQRARSPVKSLSGGERNRLLLARLFAQPSNILVLDEPTNDLDIETLDLLESLLAQYDGTLFLVSHDRAFLDNVVTQVIGALGNGRWLEFAGGYTEWQREQKLRANQTVSAEKQAKSDKTVIKTTQPTATAQQTVPQILSSRERKELDDLPDRITRLEAELNGLQLRLSDPALYQQPDELQRIRQHAAELSAEIDTAMQRWEALEARA